MAPELRTAGCGWAQQGLSPLPQLLLPRLANGPLGDSLPCGLGDAGLGGFEPLPHDIGRTARRHLRQPKLGAARRRVRLPKLLAPLAKGANQLAVLSLHAAVRFARAGAGAASPSVALGSLAGVGERRRRPRPLARTTL